MAGAETPLPNPSSLTVHRLRVTLLDVSPPVWRTFVVPSALPLSTLHGIVQIVMGWTNSHLHEWEVGGVIYASPEEEDWGEEAADETQALLGEVAPDDGSLLYRYDFGDGWEHLVAVDAVEAYDARTPPLACTGGARACPPEDCGGPSGYEHLLDALADPADPEHDEMTLLYGDSIDPEAFDLTRVNAALEAFVRDATS
ncbi:MAG: plasmid pRiA4b ORF-3 family protein [Acidimicrobiaceae bacterium]|nr:plasmid pRiA4b ORF-3 family protein [Acidimicrobiaceae bacterium]